MNNFFQNFFIACIALTSLSSCNEKQYVNFYNYDGTLLWQIEYSEGMDLTYDGEIPIRNNDDTYSYSFSGWNHDFSEVKYYKNFYAEFDREYRNFFVSFYNYDNTLITSVQAKYGESILDRLPANPTRPIENRTRYVFSNWGDADLSYITKDTKCVANYTTINCFKVDYFDYDDSLIYSEYIDEGGSSSYKIDKFRVANSEHFYVFSNWSEPVKNINTDMSVKAIYKTVDACTVTFNNYDGALLGTDKVPQGFTAKYSGPTPYKPSIILGDYEYKYYFEGWDISLENIMSNVTATAQFVTQTIAIGQTAIMNHLDNYGSGKYHSVSTGDGTTLGYLNSYYYVSFSDYDNGLFSAIAINFQYGDSNGPATFEIDDEGVCMYKASMRVYVSNHNFYNIELIKIITARYTTQEQAILVGTLSILAAKEAINNATKYLESYNLPYIY